MNVIKQRQLSNGEKLTPKSDFVYQYLNDIKVFNLDGTTKQTLTTEDWTAQYTKVGKGQFLKIEVRENEDDTVLHLNSWNDTTAPINTLKIDRYWGGENYWNSKNIITFLGKPFANVGDNDRYIVFSRSNGNGYQIVLFNIDTWTIKNEVRADGDPNFDYVFDGVDTIYWIYGSFNLLAYSKLENGEITSGDYVYTNTGAELSATRIYGMNDITIYFESPTGDLMVYDRASMVSLIHRSKATNMIMVVGGLFNGDYIYSQESVSKIVFQSTNPFIEYNLTQSLVDGGAIVPNELNISPQLITNFEDTDTTIKFTWILCRMTGYGVGAPSLFIIETTINKTDNSIVSSLVGILPNEFSGITQEQFNNSFSNTCNSYNIETFYNYGLQKQWDTFFAPTLKVLEEEYK